MHLPHAVAGGRGRIWGAIVALPGAAAVWLVVTRELSPAASIAHHEMLGALRYTRGHNTLVLGLVSVLVTAALLRYAARARDTRAAAPGRAARVGLVLVLWLVGLAYFYGGRGIGWNYYPGLWDALHYGVGAKYNAELGYTGLYDCVVQADAESGPVLPRDLMVRDLRNYALVPASTAISRHDCHALFGQRRWEEFKADLTPLLLYGRGIMPNALRDHGYNGTPLRSLLTGGLVPLPRLSFENLTLLTLADIVAISAMLAWVAVSFGPRMGALFALFVFVNFSDRFEHIGGSQLRYLWLALLIGGLCLLKRGRPASAAAAMTASAMLNVFPAVFLVGPLARMLGAYLRGDGPSRAQKRFALSAALTGTGLLALTLSQPGALQRHLEFARKIWLHAHVDNNARVGLRYVFAPVTGTPTEPLGSSAVVHAGGLGSAAFVVLCALLIAFAILALRRLDDIEASTLVGVLLLFVGFGLVQYYYACACCLVLLFHRRLDRRAGLSMIALLFGLHAAIYALWALGTPLPLCDHVATSWAYAAFLGAALMHFGRREVAVHQRQVCPA